jgi:hypothetical protein
MAESLYRRNPIANIASVLQERSGLLRSNQTIGGKSIQDRNPAWIRVTGQCNKCGGGPTITVPFEKGTWDELYKPKIKPPPSLKQVEITYGGDWGLAQKISGTIECYELGTFKQAPGS